MSRTVASSSAPARSVQQTRQSRRQTAQNITENIHKQPMSR